jgi:hypothetical protein
MRVIAGASTGLLQPTGIAIRDGELFVADRWTRVRVFSATASGDVAPLRVLAGPARTPACRSLIG